MGPWFPLLPSEEVYFAQCTPTKGVYVLYNSLIPCFSSRSRYFSHNRLNYYDPKLIFSLKEKNLVTSEEVLTTGSSPCPLMETDLYPGKYYDTVTSYKHIMYVLGFNR